MHNLIIWNSHSKSSWMSMRCRNWRVPSWIKLIPLTATIGKSRTEGKKKATVREEKKNCLAKGVVKCAVAKFRKEKHKVGYENI